MTACNSAWPRVDHQIPLTAFMPPLESTTREDMPRDLILVHLNGVPAVMLATLQTDFWDGTLQLPLAVSLTHITTSVKMLGPVKTFVRSFWYCTSVSRVLYVRRKAFHK